MSLPMLAFIWQQTYFFKAIEKLRIKGNILTFQIAYKQGCEQEQGEYNYPATQTPGYQSQRKLDPLKDVSHKVTWLCRLLFD